jgi:membrane-associated protease RseP (regulator of RpoE activity)
MPDALTIAAGQFSQSIQCPIDRVSVSFEAVAPNPPAPDVAADPARLAMYNQQIAAELAMLRMVNASGCGHAAMFRCAVRDTRHHGELAVCAMIERGKLGVSILRATRTIDRVEPGGLGERLGFRAGDVLVALDHQPITDTNDYVRQVADPQSPGHVVTVQRGMSLVDISVPRLPE